MKGFFLFQRSITTLENPFEFYTQHGDEKKNIKVWGFSGFLEYLIKISYLNHLFLISDRYDVDTNALHSSSAF